MADRIRTHCTFCSFGCELEIVRDGGQILGIEYPDDSIESGGRLCPRGSASAVLADHPMRLCYPLKDGRERTWRDFFAEAGPLLRNCPSNEIAVTHGSNLTREEIGLVFELAEQLGTENLAWPGLSPEAHWTWRLDVKPRARVTDPFALSHEDVTKADTILLVGDVFAVMPVMSKLVLYAKYADRERRLFGLDSVRTRTAGFCNRFLWTKPGTEPLIILGLVGLIDSKLSGFDPETVAAASGVNATDLQEVASALAKPRKTVVVAALQSGRTADPKLLATSLQLLINRIKGPRKLAVAGEVTADPGLKAPGSVLASLRAGYISTLLNFGDASATLPSLDDIEFPGVKFRMTTSTMRPEKPRPGWVLPVPLNLEKHGTVPTMWGDAVLTRTAEPASGTKTVSEIIKGILGEDPTPAGLPPETSKPSPLPLSHWERDEGVRALVPVKSVTDLGRAMLKRSPDPNADFPFTILASRPAYGFRGLFSNEPAPIALHPRDAAAAGIGSEDKVEVETRAGVKAEFKVRLSDEVKPGCCLVDANERAARRLFEPETDETTGMIAIPPAKAKVWRSA